MQTQDFLCYNDRRKKRVIPTTILWVRKLNWKKGVRSWRKSIVHFGSMSGGGGLTTTRLIGEVEKQRTNILIDSGSTLSFINEGTT